MEICAGRCARKLCCRAEPKSRNTELHDCNEIDNERLQSYHSTLKHARETFFAKTLTTLCHAGI